MIKVDKEWLKRYWNKGNKKSSRNCRERFSVPKSSIINKSIVFKVWKKRSNSGSSRFLWKNLPNKLVALIKIICPWHFEAKLWAKKTDKKVLPVPKLPVKTNQGLTSTKLVNKFFWYFNKLLRSLFIKFFNCDFRSCCNHFWGKSAITQALAKDEILLRWRQGFNSRKSWELSNFKIKRKPLFSCSHDLVLSEHKLSDWKYLWRTLEKSGKRRKSKLASIISSTSWRKCCSFS